MAGIDSFTKLMLHMDGADASTTFTDSSLTPKTATAVGDAQIDTAQSVFGGASGLFDGNGDAVDIANDSDFDIAGGIFTLDMRIRFASTAGVPVPIQAGNNNGGNAWVFFYNGGNVTFGHYNAGAFTSIIQKAWSPSTATWYHLAVIRGWGGNANDWAITVDGTILVSLTTAAVTVTTPNERCRIAGQYNGVNVGNPFSGHIDELRFSKGIARWTANFTPPTEAYSEDTPVVTGGSFWNKPSIRLGLGV